MAQLHKIRLRTGEVIVINDHYEVSATVEAQEGRPSDLALVDGFFPKPVNDLLFLAELHAELPPSKPVPQEWPPRWGGAPSAEQPPPARVRLSIVQDGQELPEFGSSISALIDRPYRLVVPVLLKRNERQLLVTWRDALPGTQLHLFALASRPVDAPEGDGTGPVTFTPDVKVSL